MNAITRDHIKRMIRDFERLLHQGAGYKPAATKDPAGRSSRR